MMYKFMQECSRKNFYRYGFFLNRCSVINCNNTEAGCIGTQSFPLQASAVACFVWLRPVCYYYFCRPKNFAQR